MILTGVVSCIATNNSVILFLSILSDIGAAIFWVGPVLSLPFCIHIISYLTVGNFRNLPLTIARKYQEKQYADRHGTTPDIIRPICGGRGVEIHSTKYLPGDTIVVGICTDYAQPLFGKIISIDSSNGDVQFLCKLYATLFSSHYHAHEIQHITSENITVVHSQMTYPLPASVVRSKNSGNHICIRHAVV